MPEITIPPEALEAAASAYTAVIYRGDGTTREFHEAIEAAILAVLKSWPGVIEAKNGSSMSLRPQIILPLPQESSDD